MPWRILVSDPIDPAGLERLRQAAEVTQSSNLNRIDQYDALVVRSGTTVTADLLKAGRPQLKVVGRAGVGVDNIDLEAARRLGIRVVNSPMAATEAVAEHALALMFSLARRIAAADRSMKSGVWDKPAFQGTELAGKTLGIIGVGRIGAALARRARALSMLVVGYDLLLDDDQVRAAGANPVHFDQLLTRSDFVSLHVPLTENTRSLIGAPQLELMRQGAYLISTSRGGVVDETALLEALDAGKLAGAALDVFQQEPPDDDDLVRHPRVVATPHIAAQTEEAQQRAAVDIAEEVLAALAGDNLRWQVD